MSRISQPSTSRPAIVLASSSPRRSDLLEQIGVSFRTVHPEVDEESISHPEPRQTALLRACAKLEAALPLCGGEDRFVLSADTMVFVGTRVYGKPADETEATLTLRELAGRTHTVVTACAWSTLPAGDGVSVQTGNFIDTADVCFLRLDDAEIADYLRSGEWRGVAGGYRVQGCAARFIASIQGSYATVMGLPIHRVYSILKAHFETIQSH